MHAYHTYRSTDEADLDGIDRTLFNRLDLAVMDRVELAEWLRDHGAARLSAIERLERAERLITRRRFLVGAGALMLAGCGAPEQAAAPTATTEATRTIQGVLGNTYTLSRRPARIHVGTGPDLDTALAVGVQPTSIEIYGDAALRPDQKVDGSLELIRYVDGPNLEALAAAKPDMILTGWGGDEHLRPMSDIAPTVFIDSSKPWREVARQIGTVLFKDAEIEAVITSLEARFASFRERLRSRAGQTPCILHITDGTTFTLMTRESAVGQLMVELGFAPLQKSGSIYGEPIAFEALASEAQGDFLLVLASGFRFVDPNEPVPEAIQQFLDNPITQSLPAAKDGSFLYPRDGSDVYYFTVLLIPIFVDYLEQLLTNSR